MLPPLQMVLLWLDKGLCALVVVQSVWYRNNSSCDTVAATVVFARMGSFQCFSAFGGCNNASKECLIMCTLTGWQGAYNCKSTALFGTTKSTFSSVARYFEHYCKTVACSLTMQIDMHKNLALDESVCVGNKYISRTWVCGVDCFLGS